MERHLQVDSSDAESERDPLLLQRQEGPSKLKRMIALLMEWETRYAKLAVERKRTRTFADERYASDLLACTHTHKHLLSVLPFCN